VSGRRADALGRAAAARSLSAEQRARRALAESRLPRHQRASEQSVRARLRGMLNENKRLRAENAQLRDELAVAHGEVRELKLARRRSSA
jgi:regulator of replication initiation timing